MRPLSLILLLSLAGCASTAPPRRFQPIAPADPVLLAQADSVLALPAESVTTAGLVIVERAHAERLRVVEARATTASRRSSGVVTYLVLVGAVGVVSTIYLLQGN